MVVDTVFIGVAPATAASALPILVTGVVIAFLGISPLGVLGADLILGSAPPEKAGPASSLSETSGELGVALGVATLGSVGTAVYRSQVLDTIPSGTPPQAVEVTEDSLAGATAAAQHLPGGQGDVLLAGAREAFTQGLNTSARISAGVLLAVAAVAVTLLRHQHQQPTARHPELSTHIRSATGRGVGLVSW